MKILYCTNQIKNHGGIEKITSQKINALIQDFNHEVYLVTTYQYREQFKYKIHKKANLIDLAINYETDKSYYHPINLVFMLMHYFKLKATIKSIKPDLIVSVSFTPDQYFLPFIETKIPKIKELHSSGFVVSKSANLSKGIVGFFKNILTSIFNKYNALVVLTVDELKYFPKAKTTVIPNFSDLKIKENLKREKTIIAAGRISDVKNFTELAIIWKTICHKFPDWKIENYGNGDNKSVEKLMDTIFDLGVEDSFISDSSTNKLAEKMQKSSIFAMTSITECFPMVLLEAQICGLPIVSYDCPNGPRHIVNNDVDGFLIENKNQKMFAEKLISLMENEELRIQMSKNATINVQKYSKENALELWNNLFLRLIK